VKFLQFNNIPIVVLVVGGGPRTVNTVFESLEKETPCVFLESSGESSDIFVFALKKIEDLKRKEFKLCDQNEKSAISFNSIQFDSFLIFL
jgi:hypothetical protein